MLLSVIAISLGAALGALLRWTLALQLNGLTETMPFGTLVANLVGGYLIGIAAALFLDQPAIPIEWRLFCITGFLGGLTTFSTFSAEVVVMLTGGRTLAAMATIATHVIGSLALTLLGIASYTLWKNTFR